MPAFLRKLRTRYIHIHRRLYFLNNEKLSLLSYLQRYLQFLCFPLNIYFLLYFSKFQNDSQPDAFLQSACHHVHHSSEPLPQETILNQSGDIRPCAHTFVEFNKYKLMFFLYECLEIID
jgi:hypothetical protein